MARFITEKFTEERPEERPGSPNTRPNASSKETGREQTNDVNESITQERLLKEMYQIQKQTDKARKSQNIQVGDQIQNMRKLDSLTKCAAYHNHVVMKVDAETLSGISGISNEHIRKFIKGSKRMTLKSFGIKFMSLCLQGGDSRFEDLGKKYSHLQFGIPVNRSLLGAVEAPPRAARQAITRQPRDAGVEATTKIVMMDKNDANDETSRKRKRNNQIIRAVKKLSERSNRSDAEFFEIVLNPKSFTQCVENIFASSFCVKETTLMMKSKDGNPYVRAMVEESQNADTPSEEHQSIFTFDKDTLNKFVELYNIEDSAMEHRTGDHYTTSQGFSKDIVNE